MPHLCIFFLAQGWDTTNLNTLIFDEAEQAESKDLRLLFKTSASAVTLPLQTTHACCHPEAQRRICGCSCLCFCNFSIGGNSTAWMMRPSICRESLDQVARVDLCQRQTPSQTPRSIEKPHPVHTPSNRRLSTKQAHWSRYCGVVISASIHLATQKSTIAAPPDAKHRTPYRFGLALSRYPL